MISQPTYLVITPIFPSANSHHGIYIFDQLNEIRNKSLYNIIIIKTVNLFSSEKNYEYYGFKIIILKLIDLPNFIFPGVFNFLNIRNLNNLLNYNQINDVEIAHGHVAYPSSYFLNFFKKKYDCQTILQHHGLDVLQLDHGRISLIKSLQRNYIISTIINQINKIDLNIGVSRLVLNNLSNFTSYSPNYEFVLYNGVDLSKFYKKKKIKNKFFKIGCIANFYKTKDQITLIKAVHQLINDDIDIKLDLIGKGPIIKLCVSYIKKHRLNNNINFYDYMNHNLLNEFYNSIDLFVLPSYNEALGCVYLESWATSTPFIGVLGQGIEELVPDAELMLFEEKNIQVLKNKILYFINNDFSLEFNDDFNIKNTITDFLKHKIFNNTL